MADSGSGSSLPQKLPEPFRLPTSLGLKHRRLRADHTKFIFPVIHCVSVEQARANVDIVIAAQCDGVFLINHGIHFKELLSIYKVCRQAYPTLFIGLNCLDLNMFDLLNTLYQAHLMPDAIWVDNAHIDERKSAEDQRMATNYAKARVELSFYAKGCLYFGGVAFKYQRQVTDENQGNAAILAAPFMDIVVTSGAATGKAPDAAKLQRMKEALGPQSSLAVASGITLENAPTLLPFIDAVLVATGVSKSFHELDPTKLAALVAIVRASESPKVAPATNIESKVE